MNSFHRLRFLSRGVTKSGYGSKSKGVRIVKTNNQRKAEAGIRAIYARVTNIRRDFQHKFTTKLCSENQAIVLEDLNVSGLVQNRKLAKALADIGLSEIRRQVEYKVNRYGCDLHFAERFYPSSKLCHVCGYKNDSLKLSDRSWLCPSCNTLHDRDENAAKNLEALIPRGNSEIYALPGTSAVGRSGQETKLACVRGCVHRL